MNSLIAIIVAVTTGVTTGAYGLYKHFQNQQPAQEQHQNVQQIIQHHQDSPVLDRAIKDAIKHHLDHHDHNDGSDTEIDIKISIHTDERNSNGSLD